MDMQRNLNFSCWENYRLLNLDVFE
jgi:hypothetical protein